MRALVQRVKQAAVRVDGKAVGAIGPGVVVLLGVGHGDGEAEASWMAAKVAHLRIFPDADDKMNRSLLEAGGGALVVSQFTLYGDCAKGRRPSFVGAAPGSEAERWVDRFAGLLGELGVDPVATGAFGAMMDVELINSGPVTLWIEREAGEGRGGSGDG